jgi:hypothetical protein
MATRFGRAVLADIQAGVPLEPETSARLAKALATLNSEEET